MSQKERRVKSQEQVDAEAVWKCINQRGGPEDLAFGPLKSVRCARSTMELDKGYGPKIVYNSNIRS